MKKKVCIQSTRLSSSTLDDLIVSKTKTKKIVKTQLVTSGPVKKPSFTEHFQKQVNIIII